MSHYASLQVVVPEAFILGSGELHVDMGSALNLVCIIEKVIRIYWLTNKWTSEVNEVKERNTKRWNYRTNERMKWNDNNELPFVHHQTIHRVQHHLNTYIGSEIITW